VSIASAIEGEYLTFVHSTLEGTGQSVSEQGVRKSLYQKVRHSPWPPRPQCTSLVVQIVQAFPQSWISSGQISREGELWFFAMAQCANLYLVSSMKKKLEKESMEDGD